MDSSALFFVWTRERARGPFTREQLRELLASASISGATPFALSREGPWQPLASSPHAAVLLGAPRLFDRANDPAAPPLPLSDLIAAANRPILGPAPQPPARPPSPPSAPHDVHAIRAFNLAVERRRGLHRLKPRVIRTTRRRRDYVVVVTALAFLILFVLLAESFIAVQLQVLAARIPDQFWPLLNQVLFHSPILAWGLAAFFTDAIALAWLMFVVMDDY